MEKFREVVGFLVCVAVIVFAARMSGILQGFSPDDFKNAGTEIVNIVTKQTSGTEKYLTKNSSGSRQSAVYKNYRANTSVSNYCMNGNIARNYTLQATGLKTFNSIREGEIGPSKICDSFEECSIVQRKAANYSLLENFLRNCGTTMCVFNPQKNQYIRLKNRNSTEAKQLLNGLINW